MRRLNIASPDFERDPSEPHGFRSANFCMASRVGARDTAANLYELEPGQALCPYHYECGEEEWLLVLEGQPSVRDPDGVHRLDPFDVVFFPKGEAGVHQVRNDSDATVRVLMWGNILFPQASVYPDSDKVGVFPERESPGALFPRSSAVDYFDGETA